MDEKQLEHRNWLLKQFNPTAESYYVPLAKFAYDAHGAIKNAVASQDPRAINIAFQNTCVFLAKYMEFKNEKGANFVFYDGTDEQIAIGKAQAVLNGVPFDPLMINKIACEMSEQTHKFLTEYANEEMYGYFEKWITSRHCSKSKQLVLEKLFDLQLILDLKGEEILQGKLPSRLNISNPKKYVSEKLTEGFYIISADKKTARKGSPLFIFGKGLDDEKTSYGFYVGDKKVDVELCTDEYVKIIIPNNIEDGTYDVFAKFKNQGVEGETIGLAVHINSKPS